MAGLLPGGGGNPWVAAATEIANAGVQIIGQGANNRTQKYLARLAYDKNKEMWNMQNEYNLPINQMKRLKEGGLNPNLVYGHGAVAGNVNTGSLPKMEIANTQAVTNGVDLGSVLDALSKYQDIKIKQAQEDNIRTNTEKTSWDINLKELAVDLAKVVNFYEKSNVATNSEVIELKRDLVRIEANIQDYLMRNNFLIPSRIEELKEPGIKNELYGTNITKYAADAGYISSKTFYQDMVNDLFKTTGLNNTSGLVGAGAGILNMMLGKAGLKAFGRQISNKGFKPIGKAMGNSYYIKK